MKTNPFHQANTQKGDFDRQLLRQMLHTFILWIISKGRIHGYELIKRLEDEKGFKVVPASQLYPVLKDMAKKGLISQAKEMHGKRARKVYHITSAGRRMLGEAKRCLHASALKRQFLLEMVS